MSSSNLYNESNGQNKLHSNVYVVMLLTLCTNFQVFAHFALQKVFSTVKLALYVQSLCLLLHNFLVFNISDNFWKSSHNLWTLLNQNSWSLEDLGFRACYSTFAQSPTAPFWEPNVLGEPVMCPSHFCRARVISPPESESSKIFSSRVRVMTWSSRVRIESRELSSHLGSLVCNLESMSNHTKFHVFSTTFFAMKWRPIS